MFRRFLIFSIALSFCWTTIACGNTTSYSEPATEQPTAQTVNDSIPEPSRLPAGQYPVQQVTYDDADGSYTLMLLNTPAGNPSVVRTTNLPLARLTDDEIKAGQKSYLKVESGQPSLYLTEDFKIEYVHNVVENQVNPQTGQTETVIVRQEPSFWTPFAGALAGQAIGSLLFRPHYYVPPIYQPGVPLAGFGGYGSSYNQAVDRYRTRYQAPPLAVRNRQTFRTTGSLRTARDRLARSRQSTARDRATGSGYGTSTLRRSNNRPRSGYTNRRSRSGFGRSVGGARRRR
jgi:hypothetical protein